MKTMYEIITITNKRVLTERFADRKTALSLFRVAKYGFPEGEKAKKAYLTHERIIIDEHTYN